MFTDYLKEDFSMNKKILKAAICAAVTVAFAVPAFANPFTDVPKNHWAYDAVNKLAAAGIVDGYGDGTYKGDKTMTRYEMAQIVSKAMGKVSTVDEKIIVDKLAAEFGKELNDLGVKVDGIQKQLDNQIKFSGDARARYNDTAAEEMTYRFRLGATGKINDNTKVNLRLTTGDKGSVDSFDTVSIDRFNVNTKLLGLDTTLGKQDLKLGKGLLFDTGSTGGSITGVNVKMGNLMAAVDNTGIEKLQAVEYKANIFGKAVTADYLNFTNGAEYAALSTDINFVGKKIGTEVAQNLDNDAVGFKIGTNLLGAQVSYIDYEANALPSTSAFNFGDKAVDDKGFQVVYNKAVAKNTNLEIDHKNLDVAGDQTKVTLSVKF
jgi:hypothetical protein